MTNRNSQRGSAMLVTMIVIASLLAGAAVLVSMQLASNRSSDLTRTGVSATYCAEAGLDAARSVVAANFANWGSALLACGSGPYPCTEPSWLSSAFSHNLTGGSGSDFWIYIKDNDDELPPNANNLQVDNDLSVFVVSRCIRYADNVKEVEELIQYSGGGQDYRSQQGLGRYGNGNNN
ncbi:MAG TPA: hypothetical protein VGL61_33375 [Kofleriaceae bacterium]